MNYAIQKPGYASFRSFFYEEKKYLLLSLLEHPLHQRVLLI